MSDSNNQQAEQEPLREPPKLQDDSKPMIEQKQDGNNENEPKLKLEAPLQEVSNIQPDQQSSQQRPNKRPRHRSNPHSRETREPRYVNGENDVLCSFYTRVGACRHGELCIKKHRNPVISRTIQIANLYQVLLLDAKYTNSKTGKDEDVSSEPGNKLKVEPMTEHSETEVQEQFDEFFKDIFVHISQYGEIKDLVVCENIQNHLRGNVYVNFVTDQEASNANQHLNSEWFDGRPVYSNLSPVTDFSSACCMAYNSGTCERQMCNYMHVRYPSEHIEYQMYRSQEKSYLIKRLEKLKKELISDPLSPANHSETQNGQNHDKLETSVLLQQLY